MLNGDTKIIAHVGYPTTTFKSPMIYNPWFERRAINAAAPPLGVTAKRFATAFSEVVQFTNFAGALITTPHEFAVAGVLDEISTAVKIAGACNALRRRADGALIGDMFTATDSRAA
jgi:shikimate dehydrogenase